MNALQLEIAKVVIGKMMKGSHFSICDVDTVLKMTGGIPPKREYDMLRALHCVDFADMTPALRLALPRLLQVVLESEPMVSPFDLPRADDQVLRLQAGDFS